MCVELYLPTSVLNAGRGCCAENNFESYNCLLHNLGVYTKHTNNCNIDLNYSLKSFYFLNIYDHSCVSYYNIHITILDILRVIYTLNRFI